MGWLDDLLYTLGRPQQGLFQGVDAGRKSLETDRANVLPRVAAQGDYNRTQGSPWAKMGQNVADTGREAWQLGKSALRGIAGGLANDPDRTMHGNELTQGITSDPGLNDYYGSLMGLAADPTMAIPGGQFKQAAQTAGTMARTGGNMARMAWNKAPQMDHLGNYGYLNALKSLDIPVAGQGRDLPMMVRSAPEEVAGIYTGMTGLPKGQVRATSIPHEGPTLIGAPEHFPHEATHWATWNPPAEFSRPQVFEGLRGLHDAYPRAVEQLKRSPSYADLTPPYLGNEILARMAGTGLDNLAMKVQAVPEQADMLYQIAQKGVESVPQAAYQAAAPLNYAAPFQAAAPARATGGALNWLYDKAEEANQWIKDQGQRFVPQQPPQPNYAGGVRGQQTGGSDRAWGTPAVNYPNIPDTAPDTLNSYFRELAAQSVLNQQPGMPQNWDTKYNDPMAPFRVR